MTIDILIEAIEKLKEDFHPDYKEKLISDTLDELYNVRIETNRCRSLWHGTVYPVSIHDLLDLININLYDTFGKIMRKYPGREAMNKFVDAVHNTPGFEHMSYDIIQDGFDYLNDLWHDNEEYDSNNPDGTFKSAPARFKVLDFEYFNSGGHCMISIFTVWPPEENKTIYALTNEEGCTLATVDYIRNDLNIDDYDELMIESVDWGTITGYEKYFELYRYCLNQHTRRDCKNFGYIRGLPYYLLSAELQTKVPTGYAEYANEELGGLIDTNGVEIIVSPDFNN